MSDNRLLFAALYMYICYALQEHSELANRKQILNYSDLLLSAVVGCSTTGSWPLLCVGQSSIQKLEGIFLLKLFELQWDFMIGLRKTSAVTWLVKTREVLCCQARLLSVACACNLSFSRFVCFPFLQELTKLWDWLKANK